MNTPIGTFKWYQIEKETKLRYFQSTTSAQPAGTLIILPGRASFIEKYEEIIKFWVSKNYQVFVLDWRGHGASTRTYPGDRIHIEDYSSYVTDVEKWIDNEILPQSQKPIVLYAVSMGALIAALLLQKDVQKRIDKCIMITPMFGLLTRPFPLWMVNIISTIISSAGLGKLPVPGHKYTQSKNTNDGNSFPYGLTFSWLHASFKALHKLSLSQKLQKIQIPIFIAIAENDKDIDNSKVMKICDQIPNCTVKTYEGAPHGIHHADTSLRNLLFQDCWNFLESTLDKTFKNKI